MKKRLIIICVLCLLVLPVNARAKTITAASCSQEDVQAAIAEAEDGDTVVVPAGNCTWTKEEDNTPVITIPNTKGITLQGAGIDQTVITDESGSSWNENAIWVNGTADISSRITGFTFTGGKDSLAVIEIRGGRNQRVDHCKFYETYRAIKTGFNIETYGVIDHCIFTGDLAGANVLVNSDNAAEWQRPLRLGTADAMFIEDCTFYFNQANESVASAFDSSYAGRLVFRYNNVRNTPTGNHGTCASGPGARSTRSFELYGNTYLLEDGEHVYHELNIRGGTGLIFNNRYLTASGGSISNIVMPTNYRSCNDRDRCLPDGWDRCRGDSILDGNVPFAFGNHTGLDSQTLTDNNAAWTTDEWKGYIVKNITDGTRGVVRANTATTVTAGCCGFNWDNGDVFEIYDEFGGLVYSGIHEGGNNSKGLTINDPDLAWADQVIGYEILNVDDQSSGTIISYTKRPFNEATTWLETQFNSCGCIFDWDIGDEFEITNGYPCLDQVGRSADIDGDGVQDLEPLYEWDNTLDGVDADITIHNIGCTDPSVLDHIKEGRDFYNDVPEGLYVNIPSTCEPYEAYWATDESRLYKCTATDTWEPYYTPYPYPHPLTLAGGGVTGDVNSDTVVNILDIQACVNHILGLQDWGSAADIDGNTIVNVLDIQAIVRAILGV